MPRRTFHRLTSRNGGMRVASPCFDCCCIIGLAEFLPPAPPTDDGVEEAMLGGGLHSTTATIHPLDAATQCARGGSIGRVADTFKSSSSMSSAHVMVYVYVLIPELSVSC